MGLFFLFNTTAPSPSGMHRYHEYCIVYHRPPPYSVTIHKTCTHMEVNVLATHRTLALKTLPWLGCVISLDVGERLGAPQKQCYLWFLLCLFTQKLRMTIKISFMEEYVQQWRKNKLIIDKCCYMGCENKFTLLLQIAKFSNSSF